MRPAALTIAGSDSSGGAGIQRDLRTFASFGIEGRSAVTAVTAQGARGVAASSRVPPEVVRAQIECALEDGRVGAAKTGMLADREVVLEVAAAWEALGRGRPLVVDPVIRATSGATLLTPDGVEALRERLLPLATVVTPNLEEARVLSGRPDEHRADALADEIARVAGGRASVVITGLPGGRPDEVLDLLRLPSGRRIDLVHARIDTAQDRGTGCQLSAAAAALLSLDPARPLDEVLDLAGRSVAARLSRGDP